MNDREIIQRINDTEQHYADGLITADERDEKIAALKAKLPTGK